MILLDISGADATLRKQDTLTCGMVGAKVRFRFDQAWDGLTKTAVFRCGKVTRDSLLTGDTAVIPHEALTAPGMPLQIGVYGADGGGALVIPTVWAATCPVRPGADPSGDTGADPTLPVWAEIRAKAETNGQNIGKLTGQVDALRRQAADTIVPPPIVETAAGMTVSAPDSAESSLQGLTLYGKTTQNGTPTPGAPVALESVGARGTINTTVAGKNLFYANSVAYNSDGTFSIDASEREKSGPSAELTGILPAGTYTLSYLNGSGNLFLMANESDYTVWVTLGNTKTFDYDGKSYLKIKGQNVPAGTIATYKIQLERGSKANAFEPYKPIQTLTAQTPNGLPGIPVTSGGNYTDENGQQWICDEIDFARGVYGQRVYMETFAIGAMQKTLGANCTEYAFYPKYSSNGRNMALCSVMGREKYLFATNDSEHWYVSGIGRIYIPNENVAAFEANERVTALYDLATPIETPLSAEELAQYAALRTNKPNTTVFNDSGAGMKLSYVADTKIYIDNRFTQLQNAILSAGANI